MKQGAVVLEADELCRPEARPLRKALVNRSDERVADEQEKQADAGAVEIISDALPPGPAGDAGAGPVAAPPSCPALRGQLLSGRLDLAPS